MEEFEEIAKIGQGSFGNVYKAKDKNENLFAIKHIKFDSCEEGIPSTALRQISILKSLNSHPYIAKLVKVHYEALQHKLLIVFDYYNCDLKRYLKDQKEMLKEQQIKKLMKQILLGVYMLHEKKIIHRDIKPQNVMLDNQQNAKIGDFGLARYVTSKQSLLTREVQTLWYRAPEVMLGMKQYSFAIDVWGLGCTFAEFFLRRPLFLGATCEVEQLFKVFEVKGTPLMEEWPALQFLPDFTPCFPQWAKKPLSKTIKNIPEQALNLLQCMLEYNPQKRITVADALNHPYLSDIKI